MVKSVCVSFGSLRGSLAQSMALYDLTLHPDDFLQLPGIEVAHCDAAGMAAV